LKALITGGAGFIGRRLTERLVESGIEVVVVDDLSSGDASQVNVKAQLIVGSVLDAYLVADALDGVDAIYHLAAVASVARCNEALVASHQVNITGLVILLEAVARSAKRPPIVYASSAAVYGGNVTTPLREADPVEPLSPYGADKLSCELHARSAAVVYGVKSTGFRFFNVYGPGQDPSSPYSGVISRFAERALAGAEIVIHGDGLQTRDFVFVDDVVDALIRGAARKVGGPAEVYNVCTGQETSILALAETLVSLAGGISTIRHEEGRAGDVRRSLGSPDKLRRDLNVPPSIVLRDGLKSLVEGLRG
jgi:UDP-glucose 4-epimerase